MKFLYKSYKLFYKISKWRKLHLNYDYHLMVILGIISIIFLIDIRNEHNFLFLSLLFITCIFSFISLILIRFNFDFKRDISRFSRVGERLSYKLIINNKSYRKKVINYIELFEDNIPKFKDFISIKSPNEEKYNIWDRKILYYRWLYLIEKYKFAYSKRKEVILEKGVNNIDYSIVLKKRGVLTLNNAGFLISDFFFIFNRIKYYKNENTILVLPKRYYFSDKIFNFNSNTTIILGETSFKKDFDGDFFSLREYKVGDSKKNIYYKSLAKFDYPLVKEYSKNESSRIFLLFDSFSKDNDSFEKSLSLFYSLIEPINKRTCVSHVFLDRYIFNLSEQKSELLNLIINIKISKEDKFNILSKNIKELENLGNLICIFTYFDEVRLNFINLLRINNISVKVLLICDKNKKHKLINSISDIFFINKDRVQKDVLTLRDS